MLKLWYKQPAAAWEEALPVGNGRIGAMVFGDPLHERLQLNEESIWAGSRMNNNNPNALKTLPELQEAIFESRNKDALKLADENFLGTPPRVRSYQPLGDLLIDYEWDGEPENYSRELDLGTGIATTRFTINGKEIIQQVYASSPDDIIIVQITAMDGAFINASLKIQIICQVNACCFHITARPSLMIFCNNLLRIHDSSSLNTYNNHIDVTIYGAQREN